MPAPRPRSPGSGTPSEIVLTADPGASVTEDARFFALVPGTRRLHLGLPLLLGLDEAQVRAVLALTGRTARRDCSRRTVRCSVASVRCSPRGHPSWRRYGPSRCCPNRTTRTHPWRTGSGGSSNSPRTHRVTRTSGR
ncbi:hypothetical protein ACFWIA_10400 [Streptomyces sp. NPDC127068]|uniref:hypothetical protein n=1 Tax=Streptomyces sp. NPDC127068 TaxID=3347127 RepID=UPI0036646D7A